MLKKIGLRIFLVPLFLIAFCYTGFAEDSPVRKAFIGAFEENDQMKMNAVIEENQARIPEEVKALLDEAVQPGATQEDKEIKYFLAELMASAYKEISGDYKPLMEVKKKSFDAKLAPAVRPSAVNGVHTIDLPKGTGDVKNIFRPDNIIIKKGETVRWVNSDEVAHIFSTMPALSVGKFASVSVEPGKSWEYKFEKPGEYFYICFIHHAMIGKITVEE